MVTEQDESMCVLRVTGKQLDVDRHLAVSGLMPDKVFRAGEPRWMSQPDGKRYEVSGFTVEVSRGAWSRLDEQTNDATGFLKQHEDALTRLRADPDVEDMRLDFRVDLRIDRKDVMAQFDYFPPELVSRAGALGLGLEISVYPPDLEELARAREPDRS
jgi:hypothetical protein